MCSSKPEIERFREGEVYASMVGHTLVLLDTELRVQSQGSMDWVEGVVVTAYGMRIPVPEGWYLVHHPERCGQ